MTKNKLNLRIWPRLKIGQGKYDFTLQPKSEAELKQRKEDGMKITLCGIKHKIHFICLVFILYNKMYIIIYFLPISSHKTFYGIEIGKK